MAFSISLRMRDLKGLQERLGAGQTISKADLETTYLPIKSDYDAVVTWLRTKGFKIEVNDTNHTTVIASGTVEKVASAFEVAFSRVSVPGELGGAAVEYSSVVTAPSLPDSIAAPVLAINGLQPHLRFRPTGRLIPKTDPSGIADRYYYTFPSDVMAVYNITGTYNGHGQTIAIVDEATIATSDLTTFWTTVGSSQTIANFTEVDVAGGPNGTGSDETALDVEWAGAVASGASIRLYLSDDIYNCFTQILNDHNGSCPSISVVSISWGALEVGNPPATLESLAQTFAQLTAAGITVFSSSGDQGSNPNFTTSSYDPTSPLSVQYPASDPSVTGVGGTNLAFDTSFIESSETVWNTVSLTGNATGGGISVVFSAPNWQTGTGSSRRCVPDVAAISTGSLVGYSGLCPALIVTGGVDQGEIGTSLSAPIWAAVAAGINQARKQVGLPTLGLLGPKIYPLAATSAFTDITSGNNGAYSAGTGYDLCTGLGVPNMATLASALTNGPSGKPMITSPATLSGFAGQLITYQTTATNSPTSYGFGWVVGCPGPAGFNSATGVFSITPTTPGTYSFTVSGSNPLGTGSEMITLTVGEGAPVVTSSTSFTASVGQQVTYQVSATNAPTSYGFGWILGCPGPASFNSTTGVFSITPATPGTYSFTVTAANATGVGNEIVTLIVGADAPVVTSSSILNASVGQLVTYQITATNSPTSYGFGWVVGCPGPASFNAATGVFSITPATSGTFSFTISAENASGFGAEIVTLTVGANAPVITSSATLAASVGQAVSYQVTATNSPTSYGFNWVVGCPGAAGFNAATGVFSITPASPGTYSFTVDAANSSGAGEKTVTLTVSAGGPVVTSSTTLTVNVGQTANYQVTATNSPTSYGFGWVVGCPGPASFNAATGVFSITPAAPGTYSFTVSASNASGTGSESVTLIVNAGGPVITSNATLTAGVGQAVSYQVTASNTPTSYGFSWVIGCPGPAGFNAATGVFSITPTTPGTYSFTVSASNAIGTGSEIVTLTVGANAPVITSSSTLSANVGQPVTYQVSATNTPTSYGFGWVVGCPGPAGFNATTGVFSITPSSAGTYSFVVSAANANGVGNETVSLVVSP